MIRVINICLAIFLFLPIARAVETIHLLDKGLSNFEVWMGIPHTTVKNLHEDTFQSDDVHNGTPMGLNTDIKKVFRVIEEEGGPVLHITGEIYGGLTTLKEYENYYLSTMFRWGDKKWEPRLQQKRDSGILYHCHGEHGKFWNVWKACLEFQVQESDLGDFIPLAGPTAKVRGDNSEKHSKYNPDSTTYLKNIGYVSACAEPDVPHGKWNLLELYIVGDTAVHVVNGKVVMVVEQAKDIDGSPLIKGQIQIQSEAAECFYKQMILRPIPDFPSSIKKHIP